MQSSKTHTLIPIAAMLLFVLCYISAAINYPGGSAVYPLEAGFSMRYNYLCDLLDTESVGGALNSGRYWARIGLFMLCMGLVYLWLKLPILVRAPLWKIQTMSTCAIVALICTGFLAMADHDTTVRVSGIFGAVALILALQGFWRAGRKKLLWSGMWCLVVFLLNYVMYESGGFYRVLPLLQKVTFLSFMAWFALLNLSIYQWEARIDVERPSDSGSFKISKGLMS